MKVKIKSYNGELVEYLTYGKEYEVVELDYDSFGFTIEDDEGSEIYTLFSDTFHLNGGDWEEVKC